VSVDLRGLERFVAEQGLDNPQVRVAVQKLGGKGMAKEMGMQSDAETLAGAGDRVDDGPLADAAALGGQERVARPQ